MRTLRLVLLTVAVASLASVGLAVSAGAGEMAPGPAAPLTITKVVSGPVPAGTTFTVTVTCDSPIINDGGVGTSSAVVTFDAAGAPTGNNVIGFGDPGTCTVTETVTGGATTTSYACTGNIPVVPAPSSTSAGWASAAGLAGPTDPCASVTATGVTVDIAAEDQTAAVTVTNTFVAAIPVPDPAAEVLVRPAFTG